MRRAGIVAGDGGRPAWRLTDLIYEALGSHREDAGKAPKRAEFYRLQVGDTLVAVARAP